MSIHYDDMATMWSRHFTSDFPEQCYFIWRNYNPETIEEGLRVLSHKIDKGHNFDSLASATKYATGVMKNSASLAKMKDMPAPSTDTAVNNVL
jgi:hypothetical protein